MIEEQRKNNSNKKTYLNYQFKNDVVQATKWATEPFL